MRPFRSLGLRARLILLGLAGLSAGLLVGGVVLAGSLQYVVQKTVDAGALRTAQTVKDLYESGRLVSPITNLGTQVAAVQVLDAQNRVRAASSGAELTPMLEPRELAAVRAGQRLVVPGDRALTDGPLRIVAVTAGPSTDPRLIVVAAPVAQLESSTRLLRTALLIFFPLLVGAVALIAWWLIGKTLRPVEALRRGAEEITGTGSATLLPVPDPPDEIHRLAVTLNGMLARLESSRRRQRAFVADAAHELRSPLASMRTQLEVAQHLGEAADWTATASDLLVDLDRLSRLTNDLLLLARSGEGAAPVRSEPVDLAALVEGLVQRYCEARVVPVVSAADPVWTAGDPDALTRIVANLLDNAVRHAASSVRVTVSESGPWAVVAVTDDGAGIPEADRERVFGRFTRLDDARSRDAGGSGLGLAIVRELVSRHRGTVFLQDAGPGVRAEVRLPRGSAEISSPR
ncbi:MAG: hypothetical protein QOJ50_3042 [Cryptosporangiaceae bacterium]|nr:hypothetical protein [Cryptosporangiaceae bacterium]